MTFSQLSVGERFIIYNPVEANELRPTRYLLVKIPQPGMGGDNSIRLCDGLISRVAEDAQVVPVE